MAAASPLVQALTSRLAQFPQLDPRAVLAVAQQEGLGGGIGDNGTSFGAFQLHQGGAYPSSAPQAPQEAQRWAWSPEGIDYALRQIAGVAGGLKGAPAVENIVTRFERPANPTREVQGALAAYGLPAQGGASFSLPAKAPGQAPVSSLAAAAGAKLTPHTGLIRQALSLLGF